MDPTSIYADSQVAKHGLNRFTDNNNIKIIKFMYHLIHNFYFHKLTNQACGKKYNNIYTYVSYNHMYRLLFPKKI